MRVANFDLGDRLPTLDAGRVQLRWLTDADVPALYALKGEIVRRGVKAVTGIDMPVFPKRRFQHGAAPLETMRERLGHSERDYRHMFERLYV